MLVYYGGSTEKGVWEGFFSDEWGDLTVHTRSEVLYSFVLKQNQRAGDVVLSWDISKGYSYSPEGFSDSVFENLFSCFKENSLEMDDDLREALLEKIGAGKPSLKNGLGKNIISRLIRLVFPGKKKSK